MFRKFYLYTKLEQNRNFYKISELFEIKDKNFFGKYTVNLEFLNFIKLSENRFKVNNLIFWIHEILLVKIKHLLFPETDSSVYTTTQKIAENENSGYNVENHQKLYNMELARRGFTPVETCLFMKFDFKNVYGF